MISKELSEAIAKRIEESKGEHDSKSQGAELLKRNNRFFRERYIFMRAKEMESPNKIGESIVLETFCYRWEILPTWDGNLNSMKDFIPDSFRLLCGRGKSERIIHMVGELMQLTIKQGSTFLRMSPEIQ